MNYPERIALVTGSMRTGGAEHAMLMLANAMTERGIPAFLVLVEKTGEFLPLVNKEVEIVDLGRKRARHSIRPFMRFLKDCKPDVIIVSQAHVQLMTLLGIFFARWKGRLILNEQSTWSVNNNRLSKWPAPWLFGRADAVTIVSEGAAKDFCRTFPLLTDRVRVIPNPAYSDDILKMKDTPVQHPFFDSGLPVILAAGRLSHEKNFGFLVRSFHLLNKKTPSRLIILGDGPEREFLESLIAGLQLKDVVSLPGSTLNPYCYMSKCSLFVLTSLYEGLPTVLIEALACGCKVASVDCRYGPREILLDGLYGALVPAGSEKQFAEVMESEMNKERMADKLLRAKDFSISKVADEYLKLFSEAE